MDNYILVDTVPIVPHKVGVRVYTEKVLQSIPTDARSSIHLICTQSNIELFDDLEGYSVTVLPFTAESRLARSLLQQLVIPAIVANCSGGVLFEPADHAAILSPSPVVTCMHSSHINMEEGLMDFARKCYNTVMLRLTVRRTDKIIAISEYVKETLVDILTAKPSDIEVIYHGGGLVETALSRGWHPPPLSKRDGGILYVGSLSPHKNADTVVEAYAQIAERLDEHCRLTIVGKDVDGMRQSLEKIARLHGVSESVRFTGRISDSKLVALYGKSRVVVLPSSAEGFGLPAVEALQAGTPVVTSNVSSLPEIVGTAGITVPPENVDALAQAILTVLTDDRIAKSMSRKGIERGQAFSWARTGRETLQLLRKNAISRG